MKRIILMTAVAAAFLPAYAQSPKPDLTLLLKSFTGNQKQQCFVKYPPNWIALEESGTLSVIPSPDDPLASYLFKFEFSIDDLSPFDKVYGISISNRISAAEVHEVYPAISVDMAAAMKSERGRRALKYNEVALINSNIFDDVSNKFDRIPMLHSHAPVIKTIPIRIKYQAEESLAITAENLQVRRDANQTIASATLFPNLVATETKPPAGAFTVVCTASASIPAAAFTGACRLFIERISLASEFPLKRCVASNGRWDFAR